jgi:hypothetical protein
MDEFFDMEPGENCLGFFYMGYYNEELEAGIRSSIEDKTLWFE